MRPFKVAHDCHVDHSVRVVHVLDHFMNTIKADWSNLRD